MIFVRIVTASFDVIRALSQAKSGPVSPVTIPHSAELGPQSDMAENRQVPAGKKELCLQTGFD